MPTHSSSRPVAVHDLVAHGGILFGAGVLLYQAWSGAPIEHVLASATVSGLVAYLTLAIGFATARSVVSSTDPGPVEDEDGSPEASATESPTTESPATEPPATEPDQNDDQTAPEPQAA